VIALTTDGQLFLITRDEIEQKGLEFGIHVANVQRDYVFGWFLLGVYVATSLKDVLVLKGGNCLRKGYFPNTRFSADLDFSTETTVDEEFVTNQFMRHVSSFKIKQEFCSTLDVARCAFRGS
jgi:predicted nucleotidyltransferase component of viral defense system